MVVEYTTFIDMNATHLWRTNEVVAHAHGNLKWIKHAIDIDRLADLGALANATDMDRYIKNLKYVTITGAQLYNTVESVKRELNI